MNGRISFLELRTGAVLGSISVLNELLDVALKALGVEEAACHDLALGVAELVANVCQHEYGDGPPDSHEVVVRLDASPSALELRVASQGAPFDLEAALARAEERDPLAELDGCGLGLPLLLGLFDSIDHRYEEQLGNEIVLVKRRPEQPALD